jgi:tRNA(fMet)-specific endonuclease VapC
MSATGEVLFDTNIVLALFVQDASVMERLEQAVVYIPSVVLGELYYGAYSSEQIQANLDRIDDFITISAMLSCDAVTARHYGQIKSGLRAKGRPIPENDIWIAALARQHHLTLISRDAHFGEVDGLSLEAW